MNRAALDLWVGIFVMIGVGALIFLSLRVGNLLSTTNQLEYRHKLEESFVQSIEEILTPITGAGAVKAQVTADIDFTVTETARESYNPQG